MDVFIRKLFLNECIHDERGFYEQEEEEEEEVGHDIFVYNIYVR